MQLHWIAVRQDARTPRHQDEGWLGHGRRGDVLVAPEQDSNRPLPPRRRKRRRENANEIPLTPLNTIPLPPGPANGSHTANTLQICNEQSRLPTRCALARRPAARQQKGAVSRREPRAIGSRRVFTRSRMICTTFLNLSNADAASKSQKPHFTSRQSCGGYRAKKLVASPSARPLRRPAAVPPLPRPP